MNRIMIMAATALISLSICSCSPKIAESTTSASGSSTSGYTPGVSSASAQASGTSGSNTATTSTTNTMNTTIKTEIQSASPDPAKMGSIDFNK